MACTYYDVRKAYTAFEGKTTAHSQVMSILKAHGHAIKASAAWCSETVMAALYEAGGIDLIDYAADSGSIKSHAQKKGIWHSGSSGIMPGDIVLYGKSGKTNHTEFAIGSALNISGNYTVSGTNGVYRRKRAGRTIIGYARPKYKAMPTMDNLQVTVCAVDCMLGLYGSGPTRTKILNYLFGSANREKIQAEIDRVWDDTEKTVFDMAVYAIAGFAGSDSYRKTVLGTWQASVQKKVNAIWMLRGKTVAQAAQDVLAEKYGTNAVRRLLLTFCGYDAEKVQKAVNDALQKPPDTSEGKSGSIVSLFRDSGRKTYDVDGLQGDCIIIKDDSGHALVMDTMKKGGMAKINAEIDNVNGYVDLYISHPHSDHMGANANTLVKSGKIRRAYLPAEETIHKDYKARYTTLVNDCKKSGVEIVILKQGSEFDTGDIHGKVLYQDTETNSVNMRSLCTLITVAGKTLLTCGDHHCGASESNFSYTGHVTFYKSSHHQLYTGDREQFIRGIGPDWIIGSGWQSWPIGTVGQDAKVKKQQTIYQKVGNLLPGDICGRMEFVIEKDGSVTAKGEKNMTGHTIQYTMNGKTYQKTVHTCGKTTFHAVASMVPTGGKLI